MPRKGSLPSYRRHKQSGQAVVTLNDLTGRRRDVLLGPYGSDESKAEYTRVIAEWQVRHRGLPGPAPSDITVNEVLLQFWAHVQVHYRRPDGTPTTEVENFRQTLKPLRELYGHTQAAAFGPLALKALRQTWVDAGLSRRFINQRAWRVPCEPRPHVRGLGESIGCFRGFVVLGTDPGGVERDGSEVALRRPAPYPNR